MRPGDEITKPKPRIFSLFWRPNGRPVFLWSGRRQDKEFFKTFKTISFGAKQWEIRNATASTANWGWVWSWLSYRSKLRQFSWESTEEYPFQLKFSMNPSTKRYSKATPAAVNRDTGKSTVLLQCCVLLASALQSAGLRGTCNAQNTRGTCWTLSAGRTCGTRSAKFIARRIFRSLRIWTCAAVDTPQCQAGEQRKRLVSAINALCSFDLLQSRIFCRAWQPYPRRFLKQKVTGVSCWTWIQQKVKHRCFHTTTVCKRMVSIRK